MNTVMVLGQPRMRITNLWHIRFMAFHQNMGSVYFALWRRCRCSGDR
jgi:hypothetical protein